MAIPPEESWGDAASGLGVESWAAAGADLALSGARAHQAHQMRMSVFAESQLAAYANLILSGDARSAAADRATLTDSESQNVGESIALIGQLAKVFGGSK